MTGPLVGPVVGGLVQFREEQRVLKHPDGTESTFVAGPNGPPVVTCPGLVVAVNQANLCIVLSELGVRIKPASQLEVVDLIAMSGSLAGITIELPVVVRPYTSRSWITKSRCGIWDVTSTLKESRGLLFTQADGRTAAGAIARAWMRFQKRWRHEQKRLGLGFVEMRPVVSVGDRIARGRCGQLTNRRDGLRMKLYDWKRAARDLAKRPFAEILEVGRQDEFLA